MITADALSSLPWTRLVQQELLELIRGDNQSPDLWVVGHLFRLRKNTSNRQGILEISRRKPDGSFIDWQKVIDIDELGRAQDKSYVFSDVNFQGRVLGPDCQRILLLLSVGGSDRSELHELDVESGTLIPDGFHAPEGRIFATWLDRDHILITHAFNCGPITSSGWPLNTYLWTRGTHMKDAKIVHSCSPTDAFAFLSPIGGAFNGTALITRVPEYSRMIHYRVSLDGSVEKIPLPERSSMAIPVSTTSRHVLVSLTETAILSDEEVPPGTIVAYDTVDRSPENKVSVVYVPKKDEVNQRIGNEGMAAGKERVYLTFSTRTTQKRLVLEYCNGSWVLTQSVPVPTGSYSGVVGRIATTTAPS